MRINEEPEQGNNFHCIQCLNYLKRLKLLRSVNVHVKQQTRLLGRYTVTQVIILFKALDLLVSVTGTFWSVDISEVYIFLVDVYILKTVGLSASGFMPLAGKKEKDTLTMLSCKSKAMCLCMGAWLTISQCDTSFAWLFLLLFCGFCSWKDHLFCWGSLLFFIRISAFSPHVRSRV